MVWLVAVGGGPGLRFVDGAVLRTIRSNVAVLADADTITGGSVVFRRELEATLAARSRTRLSRRDCVFLGSFFVAAYGHGSRADPGWTLHGELFRDLGVDRRIVPAARASTAARKFTTEFSL